MQRDLRKLVSPKRPNRNPLPPSPAVYPEYPSSFVHATEPPGTSGGSGGGGGGIASPLLELAREYHPEAEVYTSPDGLFQFSVKRIKTVKFQDAEQAEAVFHFNLVQG